MDGSKLYVKIGEMTLFVSADTVIWAGGSESVVDTELTMWLMDERMSYAVVGDANEIGDGGTAIKDAYELYTHLYLAWQDLCMPREKHCAIFSTSVK